MCSFALYTFMICVLVFSVLFCKLFYVVLHNVVAYSVTHRQNNSYCSLFKLAVTAVCICTSVLTHTCICKPHNENSCAVSAHLLRSCLLGKWAVTVSAFATTFATNMCNFHPLEDVARGSETQLQVGENIRLGAELRKLVNIHTPRRTYYMQLIQAVSWPCAMGHFLVLK